MKRFLIYAALFSAFCVTSVGAAGPTDHNNHPIFCLTSDGFRPKNGAELLQAFCEDTDFNKTYTQLSKKEQKLMGAYCKKVVNLMTKIEQRTIAHWESFKKEATALLKPYESLAKKFAMNDVYLSIWVGSEHGIWRVGYDRTWPEGFGIAARKEISLYSGTGKNPEEYIQTLCNLDKIFAEKYPLLSAYEQNKIREFYKEAMTVYAKVEAGLLNHLEFQHEARAILQPYQVVATKLAKENGLAPFSLVVCMEKIDGQSVPLSVEYSFNSKNEFAIGTRMTF